MFVANSIEIEQKMAEINAKYIKNTAELYKYVEEVTILRFNLSQEIKQSIKKSYQQLKNEIQFNYQESNILTGDQVRALMSTKVERAELLEYLEKKSGIKETQETMKSIDVLHKQIKHICVIMIEFLRQEVSKYTKSNDSDQCKHKKAMTVLHQTLSIAKWINNFNPENEIDYKDLVLPKNLEDFQNLVNNALDDMKSLALTRDNEFEKK